MDNEEVKPVDQQETEQAPVPYSQKVRERMKAYRPDADFDNDPEALYQALDDYDNEQTGKLRGYQDADDKQRELFLTHPKAAAMFVAMKEGRNPILAFVENFGEDILSVKENPELAEEFIAAQQKYMDDLAQSKRIEEEQNANMEASIANIEKFCSEKGLTDEEQVGFFNMIAQDANDFFMWKYTPEMLERHYKGSIYEKDVQDALAAGIVEGKNEKIHMETRKQVGDGLPAPAAAPVHKGVAPAYTPRRSHYDNIKPKA